jgi:hypothetical protein
LGASLAAIGIIKGIAESLASLLKIASGRMADRLDKRKQVIAYYGLSHKQKYLQHNIFLSLIV